MVACCGVAETVLGVNVASKADKDGVVDLDDLPFRK